MEQGNKLSSFPIGGNLSVKITSVDYINPHDITFLLTGSGELGLISLYSSLYIGFMCMDVHADVCTYVCVCVRVCVCVYMV